MKALITAPFCPNSLKRLKKSVEVIYENWEEPKKLHSPEELIDRIQKQDIGILITEAEYVTRDVFEKATKLRFLGNTRGSVTQVDIEAATEHGVPVVNTPARNAIAVAEMAVGLMLALVRHIPAAHQMTSSGGWVNPATSHISLRGTELSGKTIGIVGFGAIGRQVAKFVRPFANSILAYDPYVDQDKIKKAGAKPLELDELMKQSDFITIHCSTIPESIGLISAQRISLMKPTAYLINAASTYVIDNEAIIEALRKKRIAGAAFDVYETWPVQPDSPLLKLDNVVLTPHIAGATDESIVRHSQMIVDDIEKFLRGERPKNLLNPKVSRKAGQ